MIVTENFVMLNYPKTGSSFARKIIKSAFDKHRIKNQSFVRRLKFQLGLEPKPYQEILLPNHLGSEARGRKSQHGAYHQIPKEHLDKRIYSIMRNPYDTLLSSFEFKYYAKKTRIPKEKLVERFPNFPDLTFDQYIERLLMIEEHDTAKYEIKIGVFTLQFIRLFFRNPNEVLAKMTDDYFFSGAYKNDLPEINWLNQKTLNEDLKKMLIHAGFNKSEVEFIDEAKKVNVTKRTTNKDRNSLWNEKSLNYMKENEKFLLLICRHLGFDFNRED